MGSAGPSGTSLPEIARKYAGRPCTLHSASSRPRRAADREIIMSAIVAAVSCSPGHTLAKSNQDRIRLRGGLGGEGDAHAGATVKHRSRLARFASHPNLRQVHLIHAELHDELKARGFAVSPGQMGENVTTRAGDLLG